MAVNAEKFNGTEAKTDYAREAPGTNRWADTWNAFKGNFGSMIIINFLIIWFMAPLIALVVLHLLYVSNAGRLFPFNANTGVGYPIYVGTQSLNAEIYFRADLIFYSAMVGASLIAAVGFAGGAYSIKKILNSSARFTLKGFFHGVKIGYFSTVAPVALFFAALFGMKLAGDWKDLARATGASVGGPITVYVISIILTVLIGLYGAWFMATGVSYKLKLKNLIKNSFVFLVGSPIQTVFFAALALVPLWFYFISKASLGLLVIFLFLLMLFGLSYIFVVWMSFTQHVFDIFITPKIKKAEPAPKKKPVDDNDDDEKSVARALLAMGKSELIGRPILPIGDDASVFSLGATYTRGDLCTVESNRASLASQIAAYESEHKNDAGYAEYNKLFAEREKALKVDDKKGKKKKVSADNLLR